MKFNKNKNDKYLTTYIKYVIIILELKHDSNKEEKNDVRIFLDCDDTIINSSECIIDLLNKKNGTNKTIKDLKDFHYRSIDKTLTDEDVIKLFESDNFWGSVDYFDEFLEIKDFIDSNFKVEIVSCGTKLNLEKKKEKLKSLGYKFNGILIKDDLNLCKKCIDMQDGIQIDDNMSSIENTNAAVKILFQNNNNFTWNRPKLNIDNLYVVQTWKEICQILEFFKKNPEFVKRGY